MEQRPIKKLVLLITFLALMGISCWATSESLHLLLPSWPVVFCWIVTIAFFFIASYGSKLIVDSLNMNVYQEARGRNLVIGILLLVLFWVFFSMPTNTHTFFYRSAINDVALTDVGVTQKYLQELADDSYTQNNIKLNIEKLKRDVSSQQVALEAEIDNSANPGFGTKAKSLLSGLANSLGIDVIPTLSYRGTSPAERRKLKEEYSKIIHKHLEARIAEIIKNGEDSRSSRYKPEAAALAKELSTAKGLLSEAKAQGKVNQKLISNVDALLARSYTVVKNYPDLINISEEDKPVYLSENPVSRTHRMLSVVEVWKDIFKGKYAGREVVLWIFVAILVDVAAFLFFALATKKDDF